VSGTDPGAELEPAIGTGPDLPDLLAQARARIEGASSSHDLQALRQELLGKHSQLVHSRRALAAMPPDRRRDAGRRINEARTLIEDLLDHRAADLATTERERRLAADRLDLTEVVPTAVCAPVERGSVHLVTRTRDQLEDTFVAMGFQVAEGPEVESDWYNFEALNMPPGHPARGMWDTFYLESSPPGTVVLRTHTSPVQVRLMERAVREGTLPIHAVMPGRCFRRETPDARHLPVFHQIEGLVVDRGITFADLAGTIETFTTAYFGAGITARLRPAYFPFTEPSAEFEITCTICGGAGCRTCSGTGWIELGGCGMVDPAVFAATGIGDEWSGFAFGFGIDRCAQMRHGVPDMRLLVDNDIRFLRQP